MKLLLRQPKARQSGGALFMVIVFSMAAMLTVAGVLSWADSDSRQTERQNQYARSLAAAEAAAEKTLGLMSFDFKDGGLGQVQNHLSQYQSTVPLASESGDWANWSFKNPQNGSSGCYVTLEPTTVYTNLNSIYSGLKGFINNCAVVANARQVNSPYPIVGGVRQDFQLTLIPIFQFGMFSSMDMEISCGQPFIIGGRVHSNKELYVEPDSDMTYLGDVSAVGNVTFGRSPSDPRPPPTGTVTYQGRSDSKAGFLYLPIGTNNTPAAIRDLLYPPPPFESVTSAMGLQRFFNNADMILIVTNGSIRASSGLANSFLTSVPSNQLASFVKTNASFTDPRESKVVRPIDIDVGKLTTWSKTNNNIRTALGNLDVSSLYVWDQRTLPATQMRAVRVHNGQQLPARGLTVATASPFYVWGHYNQPNTNHLGTTNTSATLPAALIGDAFTALSTTWTDANSTASLSSRQAGDTTVNAAVMAGNVETATTHTYSGGMENFLRFAEKWGGGRQLTYNGSLVLMFPSVVATNQWGKSGVYEPPKRFWSFDPNFTDGAKLPPMTPGFATAIRGQWVRLGGGQITP